MRIVGFAINKISAEKKKTAGEKIQIKSNIDIKDIQKQPIDISKDPALKFDFVFSVAYSPKLANIEIEGSVAALDDKNEAKEVLKEWKKKKFTHPMRTALFNFIMDKCNLKALQIEEDLNIPLHVPLPKLRAQQEQNTNPANYAG